MVKIKRKNLGNRGSKKITKRMKTRRGKTKRSRSRRGGKTKRSRRRRIRKTKRRMRGGSGPSTKSIGSPYNDVYSSNLGGNTNKIPMSNYHPLSPYGIPSGLPIPPASTDNVYHVQNGGAPLWLTNILPNEVVNIPRLVTSGLGNAYNSYVGQQTTMNPLPQYQPIDKMQLSHL